MYIKFAHVVFLFIIFFASIVATIGQDVDSQVVTSDSIKFSIPSPYPDSIDVQPDSSVVIKKKVIKISKNAVSFPIPYNSRDSIRFSIKEQKVYLFGDAQVSYEDIVLKAAYIELDLANSIVYATGVADSSGKKIGKPVFKDDSEEFEAHEIKYNFETKRGIITGVITEQSGGYLHSEKTKKHANEEIHIENGKYTTCELENPHFYIQLSKAKVIPNKKIITGPANLVVEDMPTPLWIPFGFFPNKKGQASGILIPEYGEEMNRGFYLKNGGYFFALSDYADLKIMGDFYSKLSWGGTLHTDYKKRYRFDGNLDFRVNKNVVNEEQISEDYKFRWVHHQDPKARPNSNFSANVDFGSSSYNKYNANSIDGRVNNTTQSSISYDRNLINNLFRFSATLRHEQNNLDSTIILRLPETSLSMRRIYPLKKVKKIGRTDFGKNFSLSYTNNFSNKITTKEDQLFTPTALDKFKNGIKHRIPVSSNLKVLKYLNIGPSANYNERWYFKSIEQTYNVDTIFRGTDTIPPQITIDTSSGFFRSYDYDFNTSFGTTLYGMYMMKKPRIVHAVRHVIKPSVSFTYRPDFAEPKYYFYDSVITSIDSIKVNGVFSNMDTVFKEYDHYAGGVYGNSPRGKSKQVSFGLSNTLQMKVRNRKDTITGIKKVNILDNFTINTSYNGALDSMQWAPVNLAASTKLFQNIDLQLRSTMDIYGADTTWQKVNKIHFKETGKLLRLTSATASLSMSFKSKKGDKEKNKKTESLPVNYLDYYVDFDIPWNFRVNYNLNYSRVYNYTDKVLEDKYIQTVRVSGDVNLTPKWKLGFSSGYDMERKDFTTSSVDIYRDLHCWEMSFNWVPFGKYQSYNFTIRAKASILQDLKLNRRRSWYDNF